MRKILGDQIELSDVNKMDVYGLRRSRYRATQSSADMARIVALGSEGVCWSRMWGIQLDEGKVVELRAPFVPPPIGVWLGDYSAGLSREIITSIESQIRAQPGSDSYLLDEHLEVQAIH